jgi:hypothetical protein
MLTAYHRIPLVGAITVGAALALVPGAANATPASGTSAVTVHQSTAEGKGYILREPRAHRP